MTQQITIGLLMYPGAQLSAVYGLIDLFLSTNRIAMEHTPRTVEPLLVSRWQINPNSKRVEVIDGNGPRQLTVVIIPPNLESRGTDEPDAVLLDWLKAQHEGGAVVCSICTAAFVLARTGLLNGRPATTHWALKDVLATQFPEVYVQTDQMVIEDGDIITAGGVTAWIDLGLKLIDRFLGPSVMLAVAQFFLIDPNGREQRFYSKFAPQFYHGDEAILRVQHWLQTHYSEAIAIADMTAVASLGERTFLRRFKKATGMKPIEYLQALRVGKAREMLEFSQTSFSEIAWKVGYEDQGAFRKVFVRLVGLQPGEYRRRFSVRAMAG
ncbi:GlxA family transcriptional regulator [Leptothoe spongobia]|uniref:GlxA family transcriptional regulator n=1 Tax=Leptothoe spongobia TAU-MAC 1115 TaxID=1967444 RepID=A0A947DFX6_9CYAN|nr:GlxA family transcriptional regulator [Leptothoe spongobia]MBT9315843.1 GlxA family transcriptional regulator [Leptothoe spongobia TAU-MAC 1115]